jgi:hypothetical protein
MELTSTEQAEMRAVLGESRASRILAAAKTMSAPKGELTKQPDPAVSDSGKFYSQIEDPRKGTIKRLSVSEMQRMALDPQIYLGLEMHKLPILTLRPEFQHPEPEVAAFLNHELKRMGYVTIARELLRSLDYGFHAAEKIFTNRDTTVELADGKSWTARATVYDRIKGIHPNGVQLEQLENGLPNGFTQVSGGTAAVPPEKAMIFSHDVEYGNQYGNPLSRRAYRFWWWSDLVYQFANRYHEDQSIPPRKIFYEPNPTTTTDEAGNTVNGPDIAQAAALAVAEDSKAGAAIALPLQLDSNSGEFKKSWDIEYLVGPNKATEFTTYLDHLDAKKLRAMMVPERLAQQSGAGATGSYGMIESLSEFFLMNEEALAADLYRFLISDWARPLINYNFGSSVPDPTLAAPKLSRDNRAFMQDLLKGLFGQMLATPGIAPEVDLTAMARELGIPMLEKGQDDVIDQSVPVTPDGTPAPVARAPTLNSVRLDNIKTPGVRPATHNREWEKQTKAFQESLGETYTQWARETAKLLEAVAAEARQEILNSRLEILRTLLVRRYREAIPTAHGLGIADALSPDSLGRLAKRLEKLEQKVAREIIPKIAEKITADLLDHGVGELQQVIEMRLGFVTKPSGGDYWGTVVQGWADSRRDREANGTASRIRWVLDNLASNCADCQRLAGEYNSIEEIGTLPGAGDTSCGEFCRCWLEEENPDGDYQRRISDL